MLTFLCSLFLTIASAIGMASSMGRIVNQENSGTDGATYCEMQVDGGSVIENTYVYGYFGNGEHTIEWVYFPS
jgi:hypothetical protein